MKKMEEGGVAYGPDLLLRAILDDDWNAAKAFIDKNEGCLEARITKDKDTALTFAAASKRTRFVEELVKLMTPDQLELKTNECTALFFGAQTEIVQIAKALVKRNSDLPMKFPKKNIKLSPLHAALHTGNREMVSYLYPLTRIQELKYVDLIELLKLAITSDLYDTAHEILSSLKLAPGRKNLDLLDPLGLLARKPSEIGSEPQPTAWERCLNCCFRGCFCNKAIMQASAHRLVDRIWEELNGDNNFSSTLVDVRMKQLLVEAAKVGNVEFLLILIRSCHDLIWQIDEKNHGSLFHVAIKHRQVHVFNLIYEIGVGKANLATYHAEGKNNMLHLAAKLPSLDRLNIVSGAALQMQRELLWFQEIEKIVPKSYVDAENAEKQKEVANIVPKSYVDAKNEVKQKEVANIVPKSVVNMKNDEKEKEEEKGMPRDIIMKTKEGETPRDIFVRTHKDLQKNGEEWLRNTANYCMIMATLILTVVFPAAFTVPGGNNQEGVPIFLKSNWFTVFFISDAIAMLFSSSSILVFLSILTSRYTEKDFLKPLPRRLALGLVTLFISIIGMLVAFSASCFLVFESKASKFLIYIIVAAPAIPIILFIILHLGLGWDILCSTFCSRSFLFGSGNRLLKQRPFIMQLFDGVIMKIKASVCLH